MFFTVICFGYKGNSQKMGRWSLWWFFEKKKKAAPKKWADGLYKIMFTLKAKAVPKKWGDSLYGDEKLKFGWLPKNGCSMSTLFIYEEIQKTGIFEHVVISMMYLPICHMIVF